MVRAEIELAIRDETALAWASAGIPREGAWPSGAHKVIPLEIVGAGRVRVRRCEDGGRERIAKSRDLMTEWSEYSAVRERIDAQRAERIAARDELEGRIEVVVEALGGGAQKSNAGYQAPGASRREFTPGVWIPVELAERIVAGLAALAPESEPARAVRALGAGEG